MVCEYKMPYTKVKDMVKVKLPWHHQDMLCLQMDGLKFVILCFDRELESWRTVLMFNFDSVDELKVTGKRFPLQGMLRGKDDGFVFLADDTILAKVTFKLNPKHSSEELSYVISGTQF